MNGEFTEEKIHEGFYNDLSKDKDRVVEIQYWAD